MKKKLIVLPIFCLMLSTAQAADWLSRFRIESQETAVYRPSQIHIPEAEVFDETPVEDYNSAVTLNNQAIDALNSRNYTEAANLLRRAVALAPDADGFRKNYIIALNKAEQYDELLKQCEIHLGRDKNDDRTAYLIGLTYLNYYKNYQKAADYFSYAINLEPNDSNYVIALVNALENTKQYGDSVFEILKKHEKTFKEAYPYYLLGMKYLDKENYTKAIRAFGAAKQYDDKGYTYHAYIRAAYYGGYINGLEKEAEMTIKQFPSDQNIDSTKRIYKSLKETEYNFTEHITLKVSGASSLEELNFNVRPIKDFYEHQQVTLLSTEIISKGKKLEVQPKTNSDGSLNINVPKSMWSTEIVLELKYKIKSKALFGVYFNGGEEPDIESLKKDENLSFNDKRLSKLADYIDNLYLEDSENYDSQEIFAAKAATAVAKGLKYKENGVDHPVSWALDNLNKCDCTEYSRLLVALCLKKDIPARLATGFLIRKELVNQATSIGHEWCEIYVNGKGWTPVDATLQSTMHRAYFRNILNDQIFFEYPNEHEKTRIGVDYVARNSDITVSIENSYKISNWK